MENKFYDVPTQFQLSTNVSEKLDYYKRKIGIRKSAIVNGILDTYLDEYAKSLLKKIRNYEEDTLC